MVPLHFFPLFSSSFLPSLHLVPFLCSFLPGSSPYTSWMCPMQQMPPLSPACPRLVLRVVAGPKALHPRPCQQAGQSRPRQAQGSAQRVLDQENHVAGVDVGRTGDFDPSLVRNRFPCSPRAMFGTWVGSSRAILGPV